MFVDRLSDHKSHHREFMVPQKLMKIFLHPPALARHRAQAWDPGSSPPQVCAPVVLSPL